MSILFLFPPPPSRNDGEPRRKRPAATAAAAVHVRRLAAVETLRRLRRENRRPLPAVRHGRLLAQSLPQVLVLPGAAGRDRHVVLHQERHDPLPERLHQVQMTHGIPSKIEPKGEDLAFRRGRATMFLVMSRIEMAAPLATSEHSDEVREDESGLQQRGRDLLDSVWSPHVVARVSLRLFSISNKNSSTCGAF